MRRVRRTVPSPAYSVVLAATGPLGVPAVFDDNPDVETAAFGAGGGGLDLTRGV
jgi:hypothetical protein